MALLSRLLVALVVLVAIPFGGYRPWAWSVAGVAVALLGLGWYALVWTRRTETFWHPALWPPVVAFAAVVAWIIVQVSLPVTPALAHPIWQIAGDALGKPLSDRISADPDAGAAALIRLLSAAGIFWLALQVARDRDRALRLMHWLALGCAAVALYGLLNFIAGNDYLLGFPRTVYNGDVTGTFVNRNSFATYAGLGLLLSATLATDGYRRRWREIDPTLSWLGKNQTALAGWPLVYLIAALVLLMALFQSHSRLGLVAGFAGIGSLLLFTRLAGLFRGGLPFAATLALMIGGFAVSGQRTLDRIADGGDGGRPELIALTEQAINSAPLTGSGYGSFASVFPMYRDLTLRDAVRYDMAHSSYFELAMDAGIPAAIAMVGALAWLGAVVLTGIWRRTRDRAMPALAAAATILVAVHSTLDFSLQIPGVEYLFAAILGLGVAQSFSTRAAAPANPASGARGGDDQLR